MSKARVIFAVAVMVAVSLGTAGYASAVDPPKWVAALHVEAQKMIGLRWTPVPGATGYKVLRSTTAGQGHQEIAAPATPQHFDKDIEPGTTYYYVLQAVAGAEVSGNSPEKSVAIPGVKKVEAVKPPVWDKVVPQVSVEFGKANVKVGLFWKASKGSIAAYNVLRSETAGSGYALVGSVPETQYVDTTAEVGKTYYYVLSALDAATFMETPFSEERSVEIKAPEKKAKKKKKEKVVQKFNVANILASISNGAWGALSAPMDLDVDWDGGVIFVSNKGDRFIYRFSLDGEFLSKFKGETEGEPKGFNEPGGLDWDPYEEKLYITDSGAGKVRIFDGEGKVLGELPVLREHGGGEKKDPIVPRDVCVSSDSEQIVVIDNGRHKILLYDNGGDFQEELSVGKKGKELGSFTYPTSCVFNPNKGYQGDLLIADTFGARVQVRSGETGEWRAFGALGEVAGSFKSVVSVAVDRNNHIWTADKDNFVVTEFDYEGKYVSIVGQKELNSSGNYVLIMGTPSSVVAHPEKDELAVVNYYGGTIYRIGLTGELVTGK